MNKILRFSKVMSIVTVLLLGGVDRVFAGEVKMCYSGTTTTNMTEGNNAAIFGLDDSKWSVIASKGNTSYLPGLNKSGDFRLYGNADGGNTITVSVIGTGMKINKITSIVYTGNSYSNSYIEVGGDEISPSIDGSYDINSTSFVIGNANTDNTQVRIKSITIDVDGDGQEIIHIANTPETAYTIAQAHDLIVAGEALDELVYVKGKISTLDVADIDTDQYGNATYSISDDGTPTNELVVYRGYYLEKAKFTSQDQINIGDEVIVCGNICLYGTTHEFNSGNYIYSLNGVTTSINSIITDTLNENAPIYNLAGQRVGKEAKGILIQNGRKFVNR